MLIFSVIAYTSLILAIVSLLLAIRGKYLYYWVSALAMYLFSYIAGFSIGQLTVGFTFIPLALAIGHSFSWIKNTSHSMMFLCLGMAAGFILVFYVDNYWLFLPFWLFS
ncbi:hypothetical protein MUN88_08285 [Gracilibacillus caseinilyticus]|uniref:Uncharacterized protein n=1 Tax=Gracilibacillus caseinilyticus TaxID=2932256 RepID=A0ABY4F055_9BACI|nr:hypothetical protein [Gracilibacillus caseinilyticus]UOQ50046.1 hypothetical protein MUN88_08285 [Gracilibacillus caseinilyticus]